ncbi:MAG: type II secretion system F family protein [Actinomycetota bacterium]|nr:type II secretion system F family protein [Acidimicrobiia bacterium]MDQ3293716.1 type II secretion system F family protein [Actinomycetota bacterium]
MSLPAEPVVLLLLAGVVLGLGVLVATLLFVGRDRAEVVEAEAAVAPAPKRSDRRTRRLDDVLAASAVLRRAVEVTANVANRRGLLGSLERRLRTADVPVRPAELMLAHVTATVVLPIAVFVLLGSALMALVAFVLAGAGPPLALRIIVAKRQKKFGMQLPDALTTLAGSLRAGRSIGQALDGVSKEMPDPMGRELRKVVAEIRLGRGLHETLTDAAERVASDDFRWAALAMQIQAEVGGNLAELLDRVAFTIRERTHMRGEVKALTAEGRASAMMLLVLVPGLGGAMAVMNPSYMAPMFSTSAGRIMLGVCALMIGGGYLWMSRMVKIDV